MSAKVISFASSELRSVDYALPVVSQIARVAADQVWVVVPQLVEPVRARLALRIDHERLVQACEHGQEALLSFEQADPQRPIIVGLIEAGPVAAESRGMELAIEADADGQHVRVTAHERIEFVCGKSAVTLSKNGRIVVRGVHVETQASETNRIKGGRVRIN